MTDTTKLDCWCVYGTGGGGSENYGREVETPGCPTHDPHHTPPPADERELEPCEICADGAEDCASCEGSGDDGYAGYGCSSCDGSGTYVPSHCCACGGSPYCNCCSKCGAPCAADCRCPIPVQMSDGTIRTL